MSKFERGYTIYTNPLASREDIESFKLEGDASITFPQGRMRLENNRDPSEGQEANYVLWCDEVFPDDIAISWEFWPIREPGLAMMFFAARGLRGEHVLSPNLVPRQGIYSQYYDGDINALHISYFRRKAPGERAFQTCNMRKSKGFNLVAQGGDPIASIPDVAASYTIQIIKYGREVVFSINDLTIFHFTDDGQKYGPVLKDGSIGFRQMAPLMAEYSDLHVTAVEKRG
ncbi:MAG: DUF1961 family protein [Armatimonadota bacterium]